VYCPQYEPQNVKDRDRDYGGGKFWYKVSPETANFVPFEN